MEAFSASLFLSGNVDDVRAAMNRGLPAGRVFPTTFADSDEDRDLRIAFDFDGVVADDSAQAVYEAEQLEGFHASESKPASTPLSPGPLGRFFREVARLQKFERNRQAMHSQYCP